MIDSSWRDHLSELDQLRHGIGFRAYAHKDPKIEYQKESFTLFESMMKRIRENTIEYILRTRVDVELSQAMETENLELAKMNVNLRKINVRSEQIKVRDLNRIGRNVPCPCGSGKKYKKCCGI